VTTESHVTVTANSLWGAMGNSDGIEAAFWSAICGKTPEWGMHVEENRRGNQLIMVKANVNSMLEWNLLGKAIGDNLESGSVPVIEGEFKKPDFNKLRSFFTALAVFSNCEMFHIVNYTPEARDVSDAFRTKVSLKKPITIDDLSLVESYESTSDLESSRVDFVSLGCPHYDINQIKEVALKLKNKKIHVNVHFMIWTVYPIKYMSDENGYTKIIEEAGGHIYTSSCPGVIGSYFLNTYNGFVVDSIKQASAIRGITNGHVYLGSIDQCLDAAVKGKWEK